MPPTRRAKALLLATAVILTTLLYVAMRRQGPTPQSASYLQTLRTVSAAERQPHPELAALVAAHTILIFSKSWCSYSKAAKQLLTQKYHTVPPPFIVELDQHAHGDDLQAALAQLTGRNTVPNIMVAGKSIGGSDEIAKLDREMRLADTIRRLGGDRVKQIFMRKE